MQNHENEVTHKITELFTLKKGFIMTKIFTPSKGPEDWKALLADSEKQWEDKFSAKTLAHCWEDAQGFPPEVSEVIQVLPSLSGIHPLLIFPEWKVPLPGGTTSSQNDVWILAKCDYGLVSISVEGKVDESFGPLLDTWKKQASNGKLERLSYLADTLNLREPIPDHIFYQLLHRTASAVIEAERFGASQAVMIVHSFSTVNKWFNEFKEFVGLFDATAEIGKISTVKAKNNMPLHLAWVKGNEKFINL